MEAILQPVKASRPEQVKGKPYFYIHKGSSSNSLFSVKIVDDMMTAHRLILLDGKVHVAFRHSFREVSDSQKAFRSHKFNVNGHYALLQPVSEEMYNEVVAEYELRVKDL